MRRILTSLLFAFLFVSSLKAERIYIMNAGGYNTAAPNLIAAIVANGHTVDVNIVPPGSLPAGFTTSCVDPVNGYGWLCLFGSTDYSALIPQLQIFIDAGGKVFYQYEVSCCVPASTGAAAVIAGLTGLPTVPNVEAYIALDFSASAGWEAVGINGCMYMKGNAYKGIDGIPVANQFQATANLSGSSPSIALCTNFGFHFATTDFASGANNGALVGLGDVNAWYSGAEPSGTVDPLMVDFFFPQDCNDTCYLFATGCVLETPTGGTGGSISLGNDTTMCGGSLTLNATTPSATYLWQDGSTGPTFNVTASGTYWVEVNSVCFGAASDTIVVNYVSVPTVSLGNDTTMCPGSPLVLSASNGTSYVWQNSSTDSTYNVMFAGTFWVQVGTACGTFITDSITVNYFNFVSADLGNDTSLCIGDAITINGTSSGALSYLWQDGTTTTPTYFVSTAGTYCVAVTGICNTDNDCMEVSIINPATFDLGNDQTICTGDILTIGSPIAGATYMWQDTTFTSTYVVSQQGTYWVIVQVGSCQATDTIDIIEEDCTPVLIMPNVFTPNGDATNNAFYPVEMEDIENTRLIIFNRWGQEMFSSANLAEGWNGKYKGNECPEGVYFWIVNYTEKSSDGNKTLSGNVTLLR